MLIKGLSWVCDTILYDTVFIVYSIMVQLSHGIVRVYDNYDDDRSMDSDIRQLLATRNEMANSQRDKQKHNDTTYTDIIITLVTFTPRITLISHI